MKPFLGSFSALFPVAIINIAFSQTTEKYPRNSPKHKTEQN